MEILRYRERYLLLFLGIQPTKVSPSTSTLHNVETSLNKTQTITFVEHQS